MQRGWRLPARFLTGRLGLGPSWHEAVHAAHRDLSLEEADDHHPLPRRFVARWHSIPPSDQEFILQDLFPASGAPLRLGHEGWVGEKRTVDQKVLIPVWVGGR